jgi:hypothetical protein
MAYIRPLYYRSYKSYKVLRSLHKLLKVYYMVLS